MHTSSKFNTLLCHKTLSHYNHTDSKARVLWPIDFGQRIPLSPPNNKKAPTFFVGAFLLFRIYEDLI